MAAANAARQQMLGMRETFNLYGNEDIQNSDPKTQPVHKKTRLKTLCIHFVAVQSIMSENIFPDSVKPVNFGTSFCTKAYFLYFNLIRKGHSQMFYLNIYKSTLK